MPEMIQLVDEDNQPTGIAPRAEAKAQGLRHRAVQITIRDEDGNFLLQKRSLEKKTNPGKWTNAASGGVDPGEAYEIAAPRELQEEVGLQTPLIHLGTYKLDYEADGQTIRQFVGVFEGRVRHDVAITPQPEEVSETKWMSPADLHAAIDTNPAQFTEPLVATMRHFFWQS